MELSCIRKTNIKQILKGFKSKGCRGRVIIYFKREISCKIGSNNNEICILNGNSKGCSWSSWIMQGSRPSPDWSRQRVGIKKKHKNMGGRSPIPSNPDMVSFLLGKSSLSPGHVELLHNMVSRWSTQAQMCVCVYVYLCVWQSECQRDCH